MTDAAQDVGPVAPMAADDGSPDSGSAWLSWVDQRVHTERIAVAVVLCAGVLLFFPFLGTLGLWDPWETHYGEVARAMIARDDYVYPYWESAYFFSKPALSLWLMAFGMLATGAEAGVPPGEPLSAWAEWGIRIPFALIAIGAMWGVYRIGRFIGDRTTGLLAALVLGSCPQFIFIGKQAMTDGPLVGLMTAGLALFIVAVFEEGEDSKPTPAIKAITCTGIVLAVLPQLIMIGREVNGGPELATVIVAGVVAAVFIVGTLTIASRRDCYLIGFYTLIGLAALSKGLAVLAVVGPVVILYCLVAWDVGMLLRSKFYVGGLLFLAVGAPWYIVMTLYKGRDDEGLTFTQRFWMHDNFSRVGAGVHGDRAGMAYYLEQLGYGMFPWSAALPFALGLAARNANDEAKVSRRRATLFVLLWALWCYVFFTASQTKFHHYIFPAVPALAVLTGVWLHWLAKKPAERVRLGIGLVVLAVFAVVVRDMLNDPRHLVNLFTYKYDRDFPREIQAWRFIVPITVAGAYFVVEWFTGFGLTRAIIMLPPLIVSFLFAPVPAARRLASTLVAETWPKLRGVFPAARKDYSVLAFMLTAVMFGTWISHHHFNMLSQHWSQAHLFKSYYAEKKAGEPIYAYQLNWRGETFYSRNTVLQVKESGANQRIRKLVDQPGREFIITEQSRFHTLKNALSPDKRSKLQIIDRSSNKFYMCMVEE